MAKWTVPDPSKRNITRWHERKDEKNPDEPVPGFEISRMRPEEYRRLLASHLPKSINLSGDAESIGHAIIILVDLQGMCRSAFRMHLHNWRNIPVFGGGTLEYGEKNVGEFVSNAPEGILWEVLNGMHDDSAWEEFLGGVEKN